MKPALAVVNSGFEYEIDKGIPVPPRRNQRKYPFAVMKPGDSFFVEGDAKRNEAVRGSVKSRQKSHPGEKFTCRKKPNGIRVWRLA